MLEKGRLEKERWEKGMLEKQGGRREGCIVYKGRWEKRRLYSV